MLQGYKTYIIAILSAAVVAAHAMGYIDDATRDTLLGLLGAGAIGTVAAKINRMDKKVPLIILCLLIPSLTYAQNAVVVAQPAPVAEETGGIEFGIGIGVALSGRNIATFAENDTFGITHVTKTLDEGPQLFLELHYDFPVGKLGVGPVIGVFPKIDVGTVTNSETEQPVAGGLGMMLRFPTGTRQHFNVNFLWAITAPVFVMHEQWRDGFQAPRGVNGLPLQPEFTQQSVNRFMIAVSISNIF